MQPTELNKDVVTEASLENAMALGSSGSRLTKEGRMGPENPAVLHFQSTGATEITFGENIWGTCVNIIIDDEPELTIIKFINTETDKDKIAKMKATLKILSVSNCPRLTRISFDRNALYPGANQLIVSSLAELRLYNLSNLLEVGVDNGNGFLDYVYGWNVSASFIETPKLHIGSSYLSRVTHKRAGFSTRFSRQALPGVPEGTAAQNGAADPQGTPAGEAQPLSQRLNRLAGLLEHLRLMPESEGERGAQVDELLYQATAALNSTVDLTLADTDRYRPSTNLGYDSPSLSPRGPHEIF